MRCVVPELPGLIRPREYTGVELLIGENITMEFVMQQKNKALMHVEQFMALEVT